MNRSLMAILGTAAGSVAAVVVYQSTPSVAATSAPADAAPTTTPVADTWEPCDEGSKLRHDVCVRVEHKPVFAVPTSDGAQSATRVRSKDTSVQHDTTQAQPPASEAADHEAAEGVEGVEGVEGADQEADDQDAPEAEHADRRDGSDSEDDSDDDGHSAGHDD